MSDHDESVKEAWQRLTAALLIGALAADGESGVESAQETMARWVETFPAERGLEASGGDMDVLARISGEYAHAAWLLLDGVFGGPPVHRSSVSPLSSTSTRR